MVDAHGGAHHGIIRDAGDRAGAGGQNRGAGFGKDVHAVVGAPVLQSGVVDQFIHGERRHHIAVER